MIEVSKERFFAPIFAQRLDVHPQITNDRHPYTQLWEFPRQPGKPIYGKTVDRIEAGSLKTAYFVQEPRQ